MTLIIAEAGVNHNGDETLAMELVNIAHKAGADVVKFQTFKAKNLVTKSAVQAKYQAYNSRKSESQLSMLSRLELSYDAHHRLLAHCNHLGIEFLSTAFDQESLDFLVSDLGVKRLKIPSGDLTNAPLVLEHAKKGLDIIVSTGMATLSEVESALGVIAFGFLFPEQEPSVEHFSTAYSSTEGQEVLKRKVTVLHCTTEYPAPFDEINLRAMLSMKRAFSLPSGYSDHSEGICIPVAAAALGACVIEKHFTLDKSLPGPDHKASLSPDELIEMVSSIRQVEQALGHGVKVPTASEVANRDVARKSLVATKKIEFGETFSVENIGTKRPGGGGSPYKYWDTINQKATREYQPGDAICE